MLKFVKMHGAGNDFIMADDSTGNWPTSPEFIQALCSRHKGIGGDGLILLKYVSAEKPVEMRYFNSDGSYAAACGNGLRCAASFIYNFFPGHLKNPILLCGGNLMSGEICNDAGTIVRITMPVTEEFKPYTLESGETVYKGGVGVPHVICVRKDIRNMDVQKEGSFFRYHPLFQPDGANVDFLELNGKTGTVLIRTYERGVEGETLACGTGCSSAGVVLHQFFDFPEKVSLLCQGKDQITVEILKNGCNVSKLYLTGPAETVFSGEVDWEKKF